QRAGVRALTNLPAKAAVTAACVDAALTHAAGEFDFALRRAYFELLHRKVARRPMTAEHGARELDKRCLIAANTRRVERERIDLDIDWRLQAERLLRLLGRLGRLAQRHVDAARLQFVDMHARAKNLRKHDVHVDAL